MLNGLNRPHHGQYKPTYLICGCVCFIPDLQTSETRWSINTNYMHEPWHQKFISWNWFGFGLFEKDCLAHAQGSTEELPNTSTCTVWACIMSLVREVIHGILTEDLCCVGCNCPIFVAIELKFISIQVLFAEIENDSKNLSMPLTKKKPRVHWWNCSQW